MWFDFPRMDPRRASRSVLHPITTGPGGGGSFLARLSSGPPVVPMKEFTDPASELIGRRGRLGPILSEPGRPRPGKKTGLRTARL